MVYIFLILKTIKLSRKLWLNYVKNKIIFNLFKEKSKFNIILSRNKIISNLAKNELDIKEKSNDKVDKVTQI